MVSGPCSLLPRHVPRRVNPIPIKEIHGAIWSTHGELRGRSEKIAQVPREWVLEEWG